MNTQSPPSFQGPRVSISPSSPVPVESLKNWLTRPGVGGMRPMREGGLVHAFQCGRKRLHVGDFAGHQELQRVLGSGIVAEIDEALVDDFGPRFGGDVAAQIDIKFTGDLEIIGRPGDCLAN